MNHVWIVPSNQMRNIVQGDPNPAPGQTTEEQMALVRSWEAFAEASRQGVVPHMAYIPGVGTSSVDELIRMLDRMMSEIRKLPKEDKAYVVSFHSDASGKQDIYPLVCRDSVVEKMWASTIAAILGKYIGMPTQAPRYRPDLAFSRRIDDLPPNRGLLLEIGVHGPTGGPLYGQDGQDMLWKYARMHGLFAMRAFLKACGLLTSDGPIPLTVEVPPGYEKWHQGENPPPPYTRLIKLTTPYMKGEDVRWAQEQLVKAGWLDADDVDGIYGPDSKGAVIMFQKETWPNDPSEWDGIVGARTWNALGSV